MMITGMTVDAKNNVIFVADGLINKIIRISLVPDQIDNKTGLAIPNPNKFQYVTNHSIIGLGPITTDVASQNLYYFSVSNQNKEP